MNVLLTQGVLDRYVGGQMEIQNKSEGYFYRGEIATAKIEKGTLKVKFAWFAKGEGFPPLPTGWINDDKLDYEASLEIYAVSEIGDNRLALNSWITGELAVLFPSNGSKLDPSKVKGLLLA